MMSRIPKPGSHLPTPKIEEKVMASKLADGNNLKRKMGENVMTCPDKKLKTSINSAINRRAFNVIQPKSFERKLNTFSSNPRAVIPQQPFKSAANVRESMPAISISSTKNTKLKKQKRPAWDLKGRIQDIEEDFKNTQEVNSNLRNDLQVNNDRIAALEAANTRLNKDVVIKSEQSEKASSEIMRLESELKQKAEQNELLSKEKEEVTNHLNSQIKLLSEQRTQLEAEMVGLKSHVANLTSLKYSFEAKINVADDLIKQKTEEIGKLNDLNKLQKDENLTLKANMAELESKLREEEMKRRKLHNTVQELKGNIRVYCRMRPPLQEEVQSGIQVANIVATSDKTLQIYQFSDDKNDSTGSNLPKYEFSFDCVFPPSVSQDEIFNEISQLVQSSLDGYNVCIFAYGQTGSGKTYTMEGPARIVDFVSSANDPSLGMIPRSVQQVFNSIEELKDKGWTYKVETLFLEIYNETIQDLLSSGSNGNNKCQIIKSGNKSSDCLLSNVVAVTVTSVHDVYELLKKARVKRAVASTKCNEHSSRSHYVFQMKICGENALTKEKCEGHLNLIDLAGSERVKDSESTGNRLTEAKSINKSLSNLGKVILSLSRNESYIPYRDSKLTHLLATSLGGNSKTLMFVNISPDNENLNESINSLRFATTVNNCNIGTAHKKIK